MSFYRQLLVITVPSVTVLLGIYWYRRRRGFGTCDPGGSVRKVLKQELEEALEAKALENSKIVTPTKLIVKSAPIDIVPNGINSQRSSPIELTDKELDLEIEKVKAQRLYDMDTTVKKCSKENTPPLQIKRAISLPNKTATAMTTTSSESPEKKTASFSVKQDSPISCLTEQLLNSKQHKDSSVESMQSDDTVTTLAKMEIQEEPKLEAESAQVVEVECLTLKTLVSDSCETESKKSSNDKCTNSTKSDKTVKSKKSRKQLNVDKRSKEEKKSPKDSSDKQQQQCVSLENSLNNLDLNNKNDINVDVISDQDSKQAIESNNQNTSLAEIEMPQNRDSANHSPCDTMLASPSLGHFSDNHSEVCISI